LGRIEAEVRRNLADAAYRARLCIGALRGRDVTAVFARLTSAAVRAVLVLVAVAIPSVLLPGASDEGVLLVALVALFAAVLTFAEYASTYPGLIEFREAPPFNRIRYLVLLVSLVLLSLIVRAGVAPTGLNAFAAGMGAAVGQALDFPYSPVRLVVIAIASDGHGTAPAVIRAAAGMAYLVSLIGLAVFVILTRASAWPRRSAVFNVWINLPTFDPTAGGDLVLRLERDARVNLILGFLLPFIAPAVFVSAAQVFAPVVLTSPHTLVWTLTLWAFLPASLFMRGIALGRVALMVREKRRQSRIAGEGHWQPA